MRFIADEHISNATVGALRAAGHDIVLVRETLGEGTDDGAILQYAQDEDRVVLTRDDDFVGRSETHRGVVYIPGSATAVQIVAAVTASKRWVSTRRTVSCTFPTGGLIFSIDVLPRTPRGDA